MALRLIQQPWTQQPQGAAVGPATGGPWPSPTWLFNAAQRAELATGTNPTTNNTVLTPAGYAYDAAPSKTGWTISDLRQPDGSDNLCLITWGWMPPAVNVSSADIFLFSFGSGSTALAIEPYSGGKISAKAYYYPNYSGATNVLGPVLGADAPHAVGMRYVRNATLQLWVDGVLSGATTPGNFQIGLRAGGAGVHISSGGQDRSFQQAGAAVWLRDVGEAGMAALTSSPAAPWQLFEPRRVWVPVSGGGGSWSVSLTESASASDSLAAATTALVSLIESASAADIITAATIAAVALTEAASASDTQTASYSVTGSGSGSVTESASATDTLDAATTMLRALTETASADDQLAAATTMLRAISESASASDDASASYTAAGAAAITETASATDALTAAATLLVTILEAGSATDALAAATTMVRAITEQATAVDEVTASLPGSTWDVSIEELAAAVDLITGYAAGGLTVSPLGLRLSTTARQPRLSKRTR